MPWFFCHLYPLFTSFPHSSCSPWAYSFPSQQIALLLSCRMHSIIPLPWSLLLPSHFLVSWPKHISLPPTPHLCIREKTWLFSLVSLSMMISIRMCRDFVSVHATPLVHFLLQELAASASSLWEACPSAPLLASQRPRWQDDCGTMAVLVLGDSCVVYVTLTPQRPALHHVA